LIKPPINLILCRKNWENF